MGKKAIICAESVYGHIVPITAKLRLTIGNVHKEAGQFDEAKKMFRSIITNYTGANYTSLVKQAEFALEDLKDFEKEWNMRLEKERLEKENQAKQKKSGKQKREKKQ